MDTKTASAITGITDYRTVGQAENHIATEEHTLAVEIGYEIAAQ